MFGWLILLLCIFIGVKRPHTHSIERARLYKKKKSQRTKSIPHASIKPLRINGANGMLLVR